MPRTRERSRPSTRELVTVSFTLPSSSSQTRGPFITSSEYEVITDTPTPGYARLASQGQIINNSMHYDKFVTSSSGNGYARHTHIGGNLQYTLSGPVTAFRLSTSTPANPSWDPSVIGKLIRDAKQAALAGLNSPSVDTGEDILEIKETLRLLRSPFKGIVSGIRNIERAYKNRSRRDQWMSWADFLSSYWLQYRFAFSPLMRSIENIILEASNGKSGKGPLLEASHARRNGSVKGSISSVSRDSVFDIRTSIDYSVHAVIRYSVSGFSNSGAGRRWGIRARDFPETFWNVMPLSFMVDRFFNISNAISGMVNLVDPHVSIKAASVTVRTDTVTTYQVVGDTNPSFVSTVKGEVIKKQHFSYARDVWDPAAEDVIPTFKPSGLVDSATDVADLASLIYQKLSRR